MKYIEDLENSIVPCQNCKKSLRVKNAYYSADSGLNNSIEAVCSKDCFDVIADKFRSLIESTRSQTPS